MQPRFGPHDDTTMLLCILISSKMVAFILGTLQRSWSFLRDKQRCHALIHGHSSSISNATWPCSSFALKTREAEDEDKTALGSRGGRNEVQ